MSPSHKIYRGNKMNRYYIVVLSFLMFVGCKISLNPRDYVENTRKEVPLANVDGLWKGTAKTNHTPLMEATLFLEQSSATITGWWGDIYFDQCVLTEGQVEENRIYFEVPNHFNICLGNMTMQGVVKKDKIMRLKLSGTNCEGDHVGNAVLKKID